MRYIAVQNVIQTGIQIQITPDGQTQYLLVALWCVFIVSYTLCIQVMAAVTANTLHSWLSNVIVTEHLTTVKKHEEQTVVNFILFNRPNQSHSGAFI